jgi:hypothetical protein
MIGKLLKQELECMLKKLAVTSYYPNTFPEGLRRIKINHWDNQFPSRDLNPGLLECEAGIPPTERRRFDCPNGLRITTRDFNTDKLSSS